MPLAGKNTFLQRTRYVLSCGMPTQRSWPCRTPLRPRTRGRAAPEVRRREGGVIAPHGQREHWDLSREAPGTGARLGRRHGQCEHWDLSREALTRSRRQAAPHSARKARSTSVAPFELRAEPDHRPVPPPRSHRRGRKVAQALPVRPWCDFGALRGRRRVHYHLQARGTMCRMVEGRMRRQPKRSRA